MEKEKLEGRPTVSLIPGDGIGPEICRAVRKVLRRAGAELDWEVVEIPPLEERGRREIEQLHERVVASVQKNRFGLKGPITTPVGSGHRSITVALRQDLGLYANLRPARTVAPRFSPCGEVDLVVVRENTEGLYSGIEHRVGEDFGESVKLISRSASERIIRFACEYALGNDREKVTAIHKANILKCSDGLFLDVFRQLEEEYPQLTLEEMIVDNAAMQLVTDPGQFDVLVAPNLYGDILSDLSAGLIGGLGLAPGGNIGEEFALFEAVHGSAPDIAGENKANPLALLFSSLMMLEELGQESVAERIDKAARAVLRSGKDLTPDLGGDGTTDGLARALSAQLEEVG